MLLLTTIAFAIQAAYWVILYRGLRTAQGQEPAAGREIPPISVVVAARDEEANLPNLLDALERQTHPDFEVIVVDDASTDGTAGLVHERGPRFRVVQIARPTDPRKKHALTRGIEEASHELLAFTDADCRPRPTWLEQLARRHASSGEEVVLIGYSPFSDSPGLLNRIARYETFVTGFLTAAAAGLGRPYMAVGRNISYPRRIFDSIGGFAHSLQSLSGDDDLFVQEVHRQRVAAVRHLFDPGSIVETNAPATWRGWLHQKRRHTSAGRFYDRSVQLHLLLFHGTGVALWAAPVLAGWPAAALLASKLALQAFVLRRAARALPEAGGAGNVPLLELLYTGYIVFVAPLGAIRMPRRWG
jgi:glycosyltransferase involved in cell wall biosynthesis